MPLPPDTPTRPLYLPALVLAAALLGGFAVLGGSVVQQVRMAPNALPLEIAEAPKPSARMARPTVPSPAPTGTAWKELSRAEQQALAPLQEQWPRMGQVQKQHWQALARSFASLPAEEQAKLHSRMTDWANLSAQQRSQARLNYAVTNRLAPSPSDKRAQWEAYQALSADEKKRLAAKATPKPAGAATALRPVAPRKLARVPAAAEAPANLANPPKIAPPPTAKSVIPLAPPPTAPVIVETMPVPTPAAEVQPLAPLDATPAAPDAPSLPAARGGLSPELYTPN
ncbi:MAG: DUF3106 domain-containing protein [Comamonadaceae bacterium]|nr:DUF3106 domain-containing protein [Comamonadaceae bacterium]